MELMFHVFNAINPLSEVFWLFLGVFLIFKPLESGASALPGVFIGAAGVYFSFWLTSNFVHEQFVWGGIWITIGFFSTLFSPEKWLAIIPFIVGIVWSVFAYMRW